MKKLILLIPFLLFATKEAIIDVKGMTCPLCTTAVKRSLKMTPGVKNAKVFLNTHTAYVIFDEKKVNTEKLIQAIRNVGYDGKIIKIKEVK
ncbi:heavy-metal-associated domain-containing protein [Caminibacter mediatlanticus TB-2]|uniref:Heavy-metal-associated domain-containing protein n=1 Tax=Caminibacter mediatlanticus TB-2 TaxID=391592 RepID=A0ABX5VA96_9BACT|nr:heavy metal-associated domain-containing protein [Caminibacter mediatlanticus]QCT95218.1 heavy-metal-associated domain-containing protein [Caminibacter mediatlanticus TB-2]